jgi:hypothetical protein
VRLGDVYVRAPKFRGFTRFTVARPFVSIRAWRAVDLRVGGSISGYAPKSGAKSPHSNSESVREAALRAKSMSYVNRADGISELEGKPATAAASSRGEVSEFQIRGLLLFVEVMSIRLPRHSPALRDEGGCPFVVSFPKAATCRSTPKRSARNPNNPCNPWFSEKS